METLAISIVPKEFVPGGGNFRAASPVFTKYANTLEELSKDVYGLSVFSRTADPEEGCFHFEANHGLVRRVLTPASITYDAMPKVRSSSGSTIYAGFLQIQQRSINYRKSAAFLEALRDSSYVQVQHALTNRLEPVLYHTNEDRLLLIGDGMYEKLRITPLRKAEFLVLPGAVGWDICDRRAE